MNWDPSFARRTTFFQRNPIRELLRLSVRSDMISFAGGLPAPELFPLAAVRVAAAAVLADHGTAALQYGETGGVGELRDWVAARFSRPHLPLGRRHVLIVSGAQQGLDLLGRVLLDEGDEVVVESPTYLALLSAWRPWGVRYLPVRSDGEGLCLDALEPLLARRPKLVYTVPNFQNPTGTTFAAGRRTGLAMALDRHRVGLIEDDPYGELRFDGVALPSVFELAAKTGTGGRLESPVILTGTFSKILMPGLRVGWVIAPESVIERLVQAKQTADLHTGTFSQHLVLEMLRAGFPDNHLPLLRAGYKERRDTMLAALAEHAPDGVSWTRPEGGLFVFVTLPKGMSAAAVLVEALKVGVAFVPGEAFHVDGTGTNTLRLNFSHPSPDRIAEGIRRLCKVWKNGLNTRRDELYESHMSYESHFPQSG